ncbi:MAG: septum formation protein Maf [Phaeodactylibacter sp.]|nr:septum formation protein Maf [Phaeodactylibacter sp.]MCB9263737.1 septum formation protein Maf [Lewinellaceae bacterium]MCB9286855.1 septum formation protein Maf [Lewinellaceae bacterium]
MDILRKKLILASQSPRRRQLLEQAGFTFEVKTKPIDESFPEDMPVDEVAGYLARRKAHAAREFITGEEILLTADSVVILGDAIYNKPEDAADARRILRALSGRVHRVITGVCLLSRDKERVFSGESRVHFAELTDEEIDYYIRTCRPFDKAGAYAIQEWIGLCKIDRIEGTYSNIMGLPVDLVYRELANFV